MNAFDPSPALRLLTVLFSLRFLRRLDRTYLQPLFGGRFATYRRIRTFLAPLTTSAAVASPGRGGQAQTHNSPKKAKANRQTKQEALEMQAI